jgi:uncharacterized protein (TIGR02145 family)
MKTTRFKFLLIAILTIAFYSCSDDNSPGGSSNNNGGGSNNGGCSGGPTTVTDIDGNVYNVVSIGNQCWMKENLRTTRYRNGNVIPTPSGNDWFTTTADACADPRNDPANTAVYGKLYNWYAVANPAGLCPTGWHEPENWEWNVLIKFIDANADTNNSVNSLVAGNAMKEVGLTHWIAPNNGATNSSGFTALGAGYRDLDGSDAPLGVAAWWWSSTGDFNSGVQGLAYPKLMIYGSGSVNGSVYSKKAGLSVRCVRD